MRKKNGVNYNGSEKATERRRTALGRLCKTLTLGFKTRKDDIQEPLTPSDIKRIDKEIEILVARIK